jgi:GTP-binding protein
VTISATERTRTGRILQLAWTIGQARKKTVETSQLNDVLTKALGRNPPPLYNKGTGKVYYGTQTGTAPPQFTLFVNRIAYFPRHYLRYLNNQVRESFGFPGTRIHIDLRERS